MLPDCFGVTIALQLGVLYVDDKKGMKRAQRCLYALVFLHELRGLHISVPATPLIGICCLER